MLAKLCCRENSFFPRTWHSSCRPRPQIDEWFGTVLKSMFTLFTVMTLEGWPDVARVRAGPAGLCKGALPA